MSNGAGVDPRLPGMSNKAVKDATGRDWAEWVAVINNWPGSAEGHTAVARYLSDELGVDGWWAQGVTVGWERLTGRRQRHQQADGTFTANKARTLMIDVPAIRQTLLDDDMRTRSLGLSGTGLRSKATSRRIRIAHASGTILFDFFSQPDGRTRISIAHEQLTSAAEVTRWRDFWGAWLKRLGSTADAG